MFLLHPLDRRGKRSRLLQSGGQAMDLLVHMLRQPQEEENVKRRQSFVPKVLAEREKMKV